VKPRFTTLLAGGLLALALVGAAAAGSLEDSRAAYRRGDDATAMRLLLPLAETSDAGAQTDLGWMVANGRGAPQDYAQALAWRRKAADQGNAGAQLSLGLMRREGQGAPQDYAQAYMGFSLASRATDADIRIRGIENRDALAAEMTPAQIAEAQRMAREWKPKRGPRL
jgi:TPR repeat protein